MICRKIKSKLDAFEKKRDAGLVGLVGLTVLTGLTGLAVLTGLTGLTVLAVLAGLAVLTGLTVLAVLTSLWFLPIDLAIPFIIGILIITEIIYWKDKQVPKEGENRLWFTVKVKLESMLDAIFIFGIIGWINKIYEITYQYFEQLKVLGWYAFLLLGVFGIVYIYIWLNSLKYKKVKK